MKKTASNERNRRAYAAIENAMRHSRPKADNDAIIATLKSTYDAPGAMLGAHHRTLEKSGLHPHDAIFFMLVPDLVRYVRRNQYVNKPQLGRLELAAQFLLVNSSGLKVERFYMLCLDVRGRMQACILLQEGTRDGALFSLRSMLAHVARLRPNAVVISHNHPGGTLQPSQNDIDCTAAAIRALTVVGIPLLDHIIIVENQAVSMRSNCFIPAVHWLQQAPENRLLQNWISDKPLPKANNFRQAPRRDLPPPKANSRKKASSKEGPVNKK